MLPMDCYSSELLIAKKLICGIGAIIDIRKVKQQSKLRFNVGYACRQSLVACVSVLSFVGGNFLLTVPIVIQDKLESYMNLKLT